ncbi:MAG: hypothetical protein ACRDZ5_00395 [Acidimicrobiales bacterium]
MEGRTLEELLRYDSPVQFDDRFALEEVDVAGMTVLAGGEVISALARAEGQIVFDRLLGRYREIEIAAASPEFRNRITLRGLERLAVVFRS